MLGIDHYLVLSTIMFICGLVGVVLRRNLLFVLMSLEIMLNAANLSFVAASSYLHNLDGQIMVLFTITVAACEAAVGLAMVISLYRKYGTIQTDFLRILRG